MFCKIYSNRYEAHYALPLGRKKTAKSVRQLIQMKNIG